MRKHIFKKIISIVVEGYTIGDTIELCIKPSNSEMEITSLCVEKNGDDGSSDCRKIFLYVDQDTSGAITLDSRNIDNVDAIGLNANIKLYAK